MGAFKYYVTHDGGSGVFKQAGERVFEYTPPHYTLKKVVLRVYLYYWQPCPTHLILMYFEDFEDFSIMNNLTSRFPYGLYQNIHNFS